MVSTPDATRQFLNRTCFGVRDSDVQAASSIAAYLDRQLAPSEPDDLATQDALQKARLSFKRGTKLDPPTPLTSLQLTATQLWAQRTDTQQVVRYVQEVKAATWIRAVHNSWQLRERMIEFWHDHFNVAARTSNEVSAAFIPYDRDVIRPNALGNFRTLLGAVAKSTAMLYYLSNQSSRAAAPNENFARELMELHTLGIGAYYEFDAPPLLDEPIGNGERYRGPGGYTDIDVVNAAKALSGWTVNPANGLFKFEAAYHNTDAGKTVLGLSLAANDGVSEAEQILDALVKHPATAAFIATKLVRRFVTDTPPALLVKDVADEFLRTRNDPEQIAKVLRKLLSHPQASQITGQKLKRPFDLLTGFLRATEAAISPQPLLFAELDATGYTLFEWGPPNGHPDVQSYWLTSNTTLRDWNLLQSLFQTANFGATVSLLDATRGPGSTLPPTATVIDFWLNRLLGCRPEELFSQLLNDARTNANGLEKRRTGKDSVVESALRRLVGLIAGTTAYMMR